MRNILEVKNLVRSYNTATFRDSKNNVNVSCIRNEEKSCQSFIII